MHTQSKSLTGNNFRLTQQLRVGQRRIIGCYGSAQFRAVVTAASAAAARVSAAMRLRLPAWVSHAEDVEIRAEPSFAAVTDEQKAGVNRTLFAEFSSF